MPTPSKSLGRAYRATLAALFNESLHMAFEDAEYFTKKLLSLTSEYKQCDLLQIDSDFVLVAKSFSELVENSHSHKLSTMCEELQELLYHSRLLMKSFARIDFEIIKKDEDTFDNHLNVFSCGFLAGLSLAKKEASVARYERTAAEIFGRHSVKKRHLRNDTIKQNLISLADAKWTAGDLLLHNEMADELLEDNPKAAKVISKSVLLAALKPVAAKYGKVRGLKGIRKEKLPPK